MTVSTESIVNLEHKVWQAVVKQDRAALTELFSDDYVEITLDGQRVIKADVVNESPDVDRVRNYSIASANVISHGPNHALLNYHLTIEGTCRDIEISLTDRWATSIWKKSGTSWQCSFFQQSPYKQANDEAVSQSGSNDAQRSSIVARPTQAEVEFLDAQLSEFNARQTGRNDFEPLQLVRRADDGSVIAGLKGTTGWDWLYVEILWVHESYRRSGIGTQLLNEAEETALKRGCIGACLSSYSFQAPAFYERCGYSSFGQIDDYPIKHSMYFMSKNWK